MPGVSHQIAGRKFLPLRKGRRPLSYFEQALILDTGCFCEDYTGVATVLGSFLHLLAPFLSSLASRRRIAEARRILNQQCVHIFAALGMRIILFSAVNGN